MDIQKSIQDRLQADRDWIANSFTSLEDISKGGKPAFIGEVREFGGKKYKKTDKGWRPVGKGGQKAAPAQTTTQGTTPSATLEWNDSDWYNGKALVASHGDTKFMLHKANPNIYNSWTLTIDGQAKLKGTKGICQAYAQDYIKSKKSSTPTQPAPQPKPSTPIQPVTMINVISDIKDALMKAYPTKIERFGGSFGVYYYPNKNELIFYAGDKSSHEWHEGSDTRITDELVQKKLKEAGYTFKSEMEEYDPGSEKGWQVKLRAYHYTNLQKVKDNPGKVPLETINKQLSGVRQSFQSVREKLGRLGFGSNHHYFQRLQKFEESVIAKGTEIITKAGIPNDIDFNIDASWYGNRVKDKASITAQVSYASNNSIYYDKTEDYRTQKQKYTYGFSSDHWYAEKQAEFFEKLGLSFGVKGGSSSFAYGHWRTYLYLGTVELD